jgi:hypothetical protein
MTIRLPYEYVSCNEGVRSIGFNPEDFKYEIRLDKEDGGPICRTYRDYLHYRNIRARK